MWKGTASVFYFLMVASCFLLPQKVWAVPRYAVFEGVNCASCHINQTGAGKRNDTGGQIYMQDLVLSFAKHLVPKNLSGRLNPFIAVSADVRLQNATILGTPKTNSFTVPQGSFYLELDGGKHLIAYVDYDFANTVSREIFGMVHELPLNFYFKAGRINLPYGLRLEDDSSFIRNNFNLTFTNQDIGAEIGIAPGPFEFAFSVTNGVPGGIGDENLAKALTSSVTWVGEKMRAGTSFQWNKRTTNELVSAGLHGGLTFWHLAWLGEADVQRIHSRTGLGLTWLVALYSELNWQVIQGLFAKVVYDYLDPDYQVAGNLQHRVGLGMDVFPLPYSEVSLVYRVNVGAGALGDDQILARFHFFF